jgi:putative FmdB family regulatory protein
MPLYEYRCSDHGVFEAMGRMSRSGEPGSCPACEASAPRILSSVRGAQLERSQVIARDRNERSAHEPRLVETKKKVATGERPKPQRSHGQRPWVLEHG